MKKYLIIQEGEVEGCDYTLGCNIAIDTVEADNIEEAWEKFRWEWKDLEFGEPEDYSYEIREYGLKEIIIIEIGKEKRINLLELQAELDKQNAHQEEIEMEELERMEYERLKKKFDN